MSHRGADIDAARRLAAQLRSCGHRMWLDDWAVGVGDSNAERIDAGLSDTVSDVVAGAQHVTHAPEQGDGVSFDPRHHHAVAPSVGGRRIAVAFFPAITGAGQLIAWS